MKSYLMGVLEFGTARYVDDAQERKLSLAVDSDDKFLLMLSAGYYEGTFLKVGRKFFLNLIMKARTPKSSTFVGIAVFGT